MCPLYKCSYALLTLKCSGKCCQLRPFDVELITLIVSSYISINMITFCSHTVRARTTYIYWALAIPKRHALVCTSANRFPLRRYALLIFCFWNQLHLRPFSMWHLPSFWLVDRYALLYDTSRVWIFELWIWQKVISCKLRSYVLLTFRRRYATHNGFLLIGYNGNDLRILTILLVYHMD